MPTRSRPPVATSAAPTEVRHVRVTVSSATIAKILLLATLAYAAAKMFVALAPLLVTFAVAAFLAVAFDPAVRMLERRGLARPAAVAALFVSLLLAFALMLAVFVPPLVSQGNKLVESAPGYVNDIQDSDLYHRFDRADRKYHVLDEAAQQVSSLPSKVSSQLGNVLGGVIAGIFGFLTILFLTAFLLLGGGQVVSGAALVFPKLAERRWWGVVQDAYRSIGAYVAGTLVVATIAGTTMIVSLLALGLPNPLPLGLWMALLAVVPLIGATIGALPAIVVAFIAGGAIKGLIMLAIVIIYQQVENTFIQPAVLGKAVSLSPLLIFVAVLIGANLMGVLGALFAVPIAGILQILANELLADRAGRRLDLPSIAPDAPEPPEPQVDHSV